MARIALLLPVWIMWIKENQIRVELWWWIQSSKDEGKRHQAVPGEAHVRHQQEFLPGKGALLLRPWQRLPGSGGLTVPGAIQKRSKCSTQCSGHAEICLKVGLGAPGGLFQPQ